MLKIFLQCIWCVFLSRTNLQVLTFTFVIEYSKIVFYPTSVYFICTVKLYIDLCCSQRILYCLAGVCYISNTTKLYSAI